MRHPRQETVKKQLLMLGVCIKHGKDMKSLGIQKYSY